MHKYLKKVLTKYKYKVNIQFRKKEVYYCGNEA
jgi:hypothetical protein